MFHGQKLITHVWVGVQCWTITLCVCAKIPFDATHTQTFTFKGRFCLQLKRVCAPRSIRLLVPPHHRFGSDIHIRTLWSGNLCRKHVRHQGCYFTSFNKSWKYSIGIPNVFCQTNVVVITWTTATININLTFYEARIWLAITPFDPVPLSIYIVTINIHWYICNVSPVNHISKTWNLLLAKSLAVG